jgi:hypothetical protein
LAGGRRTAVVCQLGRHHRGRSDLPHTCVELHLHARHDVPRRLSRPAGADRLHHAKPRRVRQRRAGIRAARPALPDGRHHRTTHNTRSVVLKFFQDLGGAHPSTWYKAFNYNLGTKQPITFDTLFAPGTTPLDSIFPLVQRELEHQTALGVAVSPGAGHDPTNYQNFAITDDQLIFYFAQGELLPSFAGATQVQVPRSAIPPLAV